MLTDTATPVWAKPEERILQTLFRFVIKLIFSALQRTASGRALLFLVRLAAHVANG